MEGVMQQLVAELQGRADQDTPLGQAQALLYSTFGEQRQVRLAKEALAVCPDCAAADVLLPAHATGRQEALRPYGQGTLSAFKLGPGTGDLPGLPATAVVGPDGWADMPLFRVAPFGLLCGQPPRPGPRCCASTTWSAPAS
jgi:hypothetical protein